MERDQALLAGDKWEDAISKDMESVKLSAIEHYL